MIWLLSLTRKQSLRKTQLNELFELIKNTSIIVICPYVSISLEATKAIVQHISNIACEMDDGDSITEKIKIFVRRFSYMKPPY